MSDYLYRRSDLLDRDNLYAAIKAAAEGKRLADPKDIRDTIQTYRAIYGWETDLTYHASWKKMATYFAAKFIPVGQR